MLQYDVYLPLKYNDGTAIEADKFAQTRDELINKFGGLTVIPASGSLEGWWKFREQVLRDEIRIFRVLASVADEGFWREYKEKLKGRFDQEEIHIEVTSVSLI